VQVSRTVNANETAQISTHAIYMNGFLFKKTNVKNGLMAILFVSVFVNENLLADGKFYDIDAFPKSLDTQCRKGVAKLYDECGSQVDIVSAAVAKAAESGKTALIVYGAEWCVWCFVFDGYINGEYRSVYYEWENDPEQNQWVMKEKSNAAARFSAERLNHYVAENFVVAHIEGDHAPDGPEAINSVGLEENAIDFYPFIASLTKTGTYANHLFGYEVMRQSDNRKDRNGHALKSFDRALLLDKLRALREKAN